MVKALHRCNFVDLDAKPITALAVTPESVKQPLLACARQGGSIEIYSIFDEEIVFNRRIPGEKGDSITKLVWTHQTKASAEEFSTPSEITAEESRLAGLQPRLFSAGLTGLLVEWDLTALRPKRYSESYGGGIWCMVAHPNHGSLAIGCEDGGIRLFSIDNDTLELQKALPHKMHRILSLAWFRDGNFLVAGNDATTIEKWDISLGKIVATMKVEYGPNWKNTPIWDLAVVSGNTIASGDGKGNLTLFDGEFGTMLTTFRSHEADVLCLATNKAGTEIYSGGVDSKINRYSLNQLSPASDWSVQSHRRHHKHDTRSLVLFEAANSTRLFSGGMDMRLSSVLTSNFTFAKFRTLPAFPRPSPICLAPSRRLLMATYSDRAKVWRLGSALEHPASTKLKPGTSLPLQADYKEQLAILTESTHNTLCGAISSDGDWVALADIDQLRLFRISWPENAAPSLDLMPNFPPADFTSACAGQRHSAKELLFVGKELVVATTSGQVFALGLETSKCREFSDLFSEKDLAGQIVSSLASDKLASRLLVVLSNNHTAVVDFSSKKLLMKHRLSSKGYLQTLLVSNSTLAVVDSNWSVTYYPLDNPASPSLVSIPLAGQLRSQPQPFINFNDRVVLYDPQYIAPAAMVDPTSPKESRHIAPHPYREIMFMGCLASDQVVIVERPYEEILARLPPAFASKLYTGACKKARSSY